MKFAANSALQWKAILIGIEMNLNFYDLGGLGLDNIDKFKKSFGGKVEFHRRWVHKNIFLKIVDPLMKYLIKLNLLSLNLKK